MTSKEIEKRLCEIWGKEYINSLPLWVQDLRFKYADNRPDIHDDQKSPTCEILITGINPSYREEIENGNLHPVYNFPELMKKDKLDVYWGPLKRMICSDKIDLRSVSAYLDIFFFRHKEQRMLDKEFLPIPTGTAFLVDQLKLTQEIVESLCPRVIVVKNKRSAAFWGKNADKGEIWMGYDLQFCETSQYGDICRIAGLIDSPERIHSDIRKTNLTGTIVLISHHITRYTPCDKRVTPEFINSLLNY